MAVRFWIGGTGNWDASTTTNWSATTGGTGGQSVPTTADTVAFDNLSGGGTVTVTATANANTLTIATFTGTLDTNGQTLNVTNGITLSGTSTRTLTLGASTVTALSWAAATTTGLTFNANTSTINVTTTFSGGGLTYNNVNLTGNAAGQTLSAADTFNNLTISPTTPSKNTSWTLSANVTVIGTFTVSSGATLTNRVLLLTNVIGTQFTINAAVVSLSQVDFQDIGGTGAATWSGTSLGDCGGNSGITFTIPVDQHWTNASSGNWSASGNWTSRVPLPQDNVFMNKAFGTSQTVTLDMPRAGASIDWTGATWTTALTWATASAFSLFGSMTLISGLTRTGSSVITFGGRSSYTLTSNGVSLFGVTTQAPGGSLTLQDSLSLTNAYNGNGGDFSTNNFNVTATSFGWSNVSQNLTLGSSTITLTTTGTIWNMATQVTVNAGTSIIKITNSSASAKTFGGGGKIYNNIYINPTAGTGSITISGSNTFNNIKDDGSAAHSILFTAGTTQTVSTWTVTGSSGNAITINSTTTATHNLIKTGGGQISCDWLNIQHSIATPGNTWYAGLNSVNNQAVATAGSGWIFSTPSSLSGNFLNFM